MSEKLVFAVAVKSKNFIGDFMQFVRNLIGMNLSLYEDMVSEGIEECVASLKRDYPLAKNFRIETCAISSGAVQVIVYATVEE